MTTEQLLRQISRRLDLIEKRLRCEDDKLLTTKQAADMLGCTSGALRMRASRGYIACVKNSKGRLYFHKSDILNSITL